MTYNVFSGTLNPTQSIKATTRSELWEVLFLTPSVYGSFLFVYEIFREPLNGFAPHSHGRRV